jgi:hypothetical protein
MQAFVYGTSKINPFLDAHNARKTINLTLEFNGGGRRSLTTSRSAIITRSQESLKRYARRIRASTDGLPERCISLTHGSSHSRRDFFEDNEAWREAERTLIEWAKELARRAYQNSSDRNRPVELIEGDADEFIKEFEKETAQGFTSESEREQALQDITDREQSIDKAISPSRTDEENEALRRKKEEIARLRQNAARPKSLIDESELTRHRDVGLAERPGQAPRDRHSRGGFGFNLLALTGRPCITLTPALGAEKPPPRFTELCGNLGDDG